MCCCSGGDMPFDTVSRTTSGQRPPRFRPRGAHNAEAPTRRAGRPLMARLLSRHRSGSPPSRRYHHHHPAVNHTYPHQRRSRRPCATSSAPRPARRVQHRAALPTTKTIDVQIAKPFMLASDRADQLALSAPTASLLRHPTTLPSLGPRGLGKRPDNCVLAVTWLPRLPDCCAVPRQVPPLDDDKESDPPFRQTGEFRHSSRCPNARVRDVDDLSGRNSRSGIDHGTELTRHRAAIVSSATLPPVADRAQFDEGYVRSGACIRHLPRDDRPRRRRLDALCQPQSATYDYAITGASRPQLLQHVAGADAVPKGPIPQTGPCVDALRPDLLDVDYNLDLATRSPQRCKHDGARH